MNEQEVKSFLAQFEEAPKRISEWPQWMQDAAYEAAATFPKPPGEEPQSPTTTGGEKEREGEKR